MRVWLNHWDRYVAVADDKRRTYLSKKYGNGKPPFAQVEKSVPLMVDGKIFFVRMVYSRKDKKMLADIREYVLNESSTQDSFDPTPHAITIPIDGMDFIFGTALKMARKHRKKKVSNHLKEELNNDLK